MHFYWINYTCGFDGIECQDDEEAIFLAISAKAESVDRYPVGKIWENPKNFTRGQKSGQAPIENSQRD